MNQKEVIQLINDYWKFDNDQDNLSTWHDKQDLISEIEKLTLTDVVTSEIASSDLNNVLGYLTAMSFDKPELSNDLIEPLNTLSEAISEVENLSLSGVVKSSTCDVCYEETNNVKDNEDYRYCNSCEKL